VRIKVALVSRADDRREDLLRLGATRRAVAAADLAGHDRRPERMFRAPVGRIDRSGVEEKGEERRPLDREVCRESLDVGDRPGVIEMRIEALEQPTARHGKPMRRNAAVQIPVAEPERLLQDRAHGRDEDGTRVIGVEEPTSSQQMGETALMEGAREAAIGRPPVAHNDAGKRAAEQTGSFRIAAPSLNPIDGCVPRGDGPEPVQPTGDLPTRFIGCHNGAAADLVAQRSIGRPRLPGRTVHGVHQTAARDGQAVLLMKECGDLPEREPELFIEDDGEGDRLRAELDAGGAQRVGGLQGMAPLHPTRARATVADVNPERSDDDARHRQFFLILQRPPRLADRPATVWALVRQRRLVGFVDATRTAAPGLRPILRAGFASRSPGMRGKRLRERRRLTMRGPACLVQLTLQPLDFSMQALALALQSFVLSSQPLLFALRSIALALRTFGALTQFVDLARPLIVISACRQLRHAAFMPDSRKKYKYGILDSSRWDRARVRTR
jgi:hypothetical protein